MNERVDIDEGKVFPIIFDNKNMIYPNEGSKHMLIIDSCGSLGALKTEIIKNHE